MTENMQCLPFAGGWAEQPDYLAQIINLFRVEQDRWEQEQLEEEQKRAKEKRTA